MPLTRSDDDYAERDGDVVFRMRDGEKLVTCRVSFEALADFTNSTGASVIGMFEDHRDLVERAASNVYEVGESFDEEGRVFVTLAALNQASRS